MVNVNLTTLDVNVGKGIIVNVDVARAFAHDAVTEHVIGLGFRNCLMDTHAGVVAKDFETEAMYIEASREKVMAKLAAMYDGSVRTRSAVSGPSAFEKVMVREAFKLLPKAKRKELAELEDKGSAYINAVIEKNRVKIEELARKAIAEAEEKARQAEELGKTLDLDIEL